MDFNSLFAQFAPQLAGVADAAPAAGGPLAAPASPLSTPLPQRAPFPMAAPQAAPRRPGKMDLVAELAPLLVSSFAALKGNPGEGGAFMQGIARGREVARARQIEAENRELERKQTAARYMQQVAADAQQFQTVEEHQKYLEYAERVGSAFGIQPGELTQTIAFPKTKAAAAKQKAAQARLQQLESSANYRDIIGTPQEEGLSVTMDDGERLTVAQLRARAGLALTDATGRQVTPTPKPEKPAATTDYGDFLARYATKIGKTVQTMTADDEVAARKAWGQADDRPVDPALRGLQQTGAELSNELKRLQIEAKKNPNAAGLSTSAQRRVDAKAKAFDAQPAVKRAATMAESVSFANGLDPNTKNPADDQALIYAFAKAMDPDSVVREGEYATVQKYAQSWAERFGFDVRRVFSNTAFLTPQARANMKTTIQQKFAAGKTQYDNLRRSYAEQINRITGQADGADYLVDYAGAFPQAPAPATAAPPRKIGRFEVEIH